jgi:hypothetical protein
MIGSRRSGKSSLVADDLLEVLSVRWSMVELLCGSQASRRQAPLRLRVHVCQDGPEERDGDRSLLAGVALDEAPLKQPAPVRKLVPERRDRLSSSLDEVMAGQARWKPEAVAEDLSRFQENRCEVFPPWVNNIDPPAARATYGAPAA